MIFFFDILFRKPKNFLESLVTLLYLQVQLKSFTIFFFRQWSRFNTTSVKKGRVDKSERGGKKKRKTKRRDGQEMSTKVDSHRETGDFY